MPLPPVMLIPQMRHLVRLELITPTQLVKLRPPITPTTPQLPALLPWLQPRLMPLNLAGNLQHTTGVWSAPGRVKGHVMERV
jgi:hypothetical protein